MFNGLSTLVSKTKSLGSNPSTCAIYGISLMAKTPSSQEGEGYSFRRRGELDVTTGSIPPSRAIYRYMSQGWRWKLQISVGRFDSYYLCNLEGKPVGEQGQFAKLYEP